MTINRTHVVSSPCDWLRLPAMKNLQGKIKILRYLINTLCAYRSLRVGKRLRRLSGQIRSLNVVHQQLPTIRWQQITLRNHRIQLIIIALNQVNLRIYQLVPTCKARGVTRGKAKRMSPVYIHAHTLVCCMTLERGITTDHHGRAVPLCDWFQTRQCVAPQDGKPRRRDRGRRRNCYQPRSTSRYNGERRRALSLINSRMQY